MQGFRPLLFIPVFVLMSLLITPWAQAKSPPSAFTISKTDTYDEVSLSPDGKHVAAIATEMTHYCLDEDTRVLDPEAGECKDRPFKINASRRVIMYNLDSFEPVKIFRMPSGGRAVGLEWGSNTHLLATGFWPPKLQGNMISFGGVRTFSVSLTGSEDAAYLFSDQVKVAKQNYNLSNITNRLRHDPDHIIMPANRNGDLDLWKVNVVTGKAERIARGKEHTFYWYTDDNGLPVMRFDCSSRSCRKINVYTPGEDPKKWKKIKSFKTRPDESEDEYNFWPIAQSKDPKKFYVMSYEDEDERQSIKLYDLTTETFTDTVFEHAEVDVGGAFIDPLTGEYGGAFFVKDRLDYVLTDPKLQAHYEKIQRYFKDDANVSILGFNADKSKAVVYVTAPNNPGSYHIFEAKSGNVIQLFMRNPDLDQRFATKTDILTISARDGTPLTAYHTTPTDRVASGLAPLLVMPHGGPEGRDAYNYDPWVQYFATRGFQVLQVNFRGSSGYGRSFAEAGYGEWGGLMQDDVIDSVKHIYDKGLAVPENACSFGYSYGGYAALYAGAKTPELFACTVAGGGVTDLPLFLKQFRKRHGLGDEIYDYWKMSIGDPKADKKRLKASSPVNLADEFMKPVLLLHGNRDVIVDVSQSEKMYEALIKAGKSAEYVELTGSGHSGWGVRTDVKFLESIETFLGKHLTGQTLP